MPVVSVIVPVYNEEKYVLECLNSIASQTFQDFEVIVINDGSTDSTVSIVENFCKSDERFKLISTENRGVSKARNLGIEKATGNFLTFVDADDCLQPQAIERMYDLLRINNANVCVCGLDKGLHYKVNSVERKKKPEFYNYARAMKKALYQSRIMNSACGSLFETSLLKPDLRFREGIRFEDLDAFYRFYEKATTIIFINEPLYFYRENSGSFTHQWSIERLDVLDVTDRMEEYFQHRYPSLRHAAADRRFSAHFNTLLLMLSNNITDSLALRRCFNVIKSHRLKTLLNPNVRLRNKLGALLSYGGIKTIRYVDRLRTHE